MRGILLNISLHNITLYFFKIYFSSLYFSFKRITVEAPLMVTSFVPAESPYIGSCLNLYNSNGQNNLSTTASFCNDRWKNLEWSWNLIRIARWLIAAIVFWLCSSFTTAVSKKKIVYDTFGECCEPYSFCYVNILIQNIQDFSVLYLYILIIYDYQYGIQ